MDTLNKHKGKRNVCQKPIVKHQLIEGVCGIRPKVTSDAMSNSPSHSQLNTMKFGRRIW